MMNDEKNLFRNDYNLGEKLYDADYYGVYDEGVLVRYVGRDKMVIRRENGEEVEVYGGDMMNEKEFEEMEW